MALIAPIVDTPLVRGVDRLIRNFFDQSLINQSSVSEIPMDVIETEGQVIIKAQIPGVEKQNIKIKLTDDVLTLGVFHQEQKEEKGSRYHRSEISFAQTQRSIRLPYPVAKNSAKSTLKNGILEIVIDKSEHQDTHEIIIS